MIRHAEKSGLNLFIRWSVLTMLAFALTACAGNKKASKLSSLSAKHVSLTTAQFNQAAKTEAALLEQLTLGLKIAMARREVATSEIMDVIEIKKIALKTDKVRSNYFNSLMKMAEVQQEHLASSSKLYNDTIRFSAPQVETPEQKAQMQRLKSINSLLKTLAKEEDIFSAMKRYAKYAEDIQKAVDEMKEKEEKESGDEEK